MDEARLQMLEQILEEMDFLMLLQILPISLWVAVAILVLVAVFVGAVIGASNANTETSPSSLTPTLEKNTLYKVRLVDGMNTIQSWDVEGYSWNDDQSLDLELKDDREVTIVPSENQHIIIESM